MEGEEPFLVWRRDLDSITGLLLGLVNNKDVVSPLSDLVRKPVVPSLLFLEMFDVEFCLYLTCSPIEGSLLPDFRCLGRRIFWISVAVSTSSLVCSP